MRRVRLSALLHRPARASSRSSPPVAAAPTTRQRRLRRAPRAAPDRGQAGRRPHLPRRGDVDYLDPGQTLLHVRLQGAVRDQPAAVLASARERREAAARPRRRRAADLRGQEDDHDQDQAGRQVRAAGQPRGRRPTDVKYAIERAFSANVPSGYATSYFAEIDGAPDEPTKGVKDDPGHRDARRPDARRSSSTEPVAAARRRRAGDADHHAGAEGVRGEVRREVAVEYDQYVAFTGPYMVKNDAETGKVDGPPAGQADRDGPQPELGQGHGLPSRVPGLDHDRGGQRRPDGGLAPHARRAERPVLRLRPAADPDPEPRAHAEQGPARPRRRRRHALDRAEHHEEAVRQPQRPQGRHRRLRPRRAAPDARRRVRGRPDRAGASSRRGSPATRSPAARRASTGVRLHGEPEGRPGGQKKYLDAAKEDGVDDDGKYAGRTSS